MREAGGGRAKLALYGAHQTRLGSEKAGITGLFRTSLPIVFVVAISSCPRAQRRKKRRAGEKTRMRGTPPEEGRHSAGAPQSRIRSLIYDKMINN